MNPNCPTQKNSVILAQAGIQLIDNNPAKRDNTTTWHPQGVGCGCLAEVLAPFGGKGLKPQQHTLSAARNVLLLDSRLRGNDVAWSSQI